MYSCDWLPKLHGARPLLEVNSRPNGQEITLMKPDDSLSCSRESATEPCHDIYNTPSFNHIHYIRNGEKYDVRRRFSSLYYIITINIYR
jgi:hypothetical protein